MSEEEWKEERAERFSSVLPSLIPDGSEVEKYREVSRGVERCLLY
jgi:hypothetical protein